jgi:AraC-like DNA-binding protein
MSCPSFKKATELARKYVQIRNQLILISYEGSATDASLNSESSESTASTENTKICFDVSKIDPNLYRFEIDASLSSLYIVLQELFGGTEGILEIHFSYPAPQDLSLYQQIFDVPLVFNQSKSGICINTAVLQGTGRLTDATVSLVAEQQCEKLLSQLTRKDQSLANQIRQLLLQSPKSLPTQEAISQQLNMTSRTLARKLAKEGVTYKEITEDLRKRIALKCIENTQWSVEDIATILKYSDAANFSRAFKRWTGLYPGQYRKTIEQ